MHSNATPFVVSQKFPEGLIHERIPTLIEAVGERVQPQSVVVPCRHAPPPPHAAIPDPLIELASTAGQVAMYLDFCQSVEMFRGTF